MNYYNLNLIVVVLACAGVVAALQIRHGKELKALRRELAAAPATEPTAAQIAAVCRAAYYSSQGDIELTDDEARAIAKAAITGTVV